MELLKAGIPKWALIPELPAQYQNCTVHSWKVAHCWNLTLFQFNYSCCYLKDKKMPHFFAGNFESALKFCKRNESTNQGIRLLNFLSVFCCFGVLQNWLDTSQVLRGPSACKQLTLPASSTRYFFTHFTFISLICISSSVLSHKSREVSALIKRWSCKET